MAAISYPHLSMNNYQRRISYMIAASSSEQTNSSGKTEELRGKPKRFRLYRMSLEGKIAVANLILIGLLIVIYVMVFPNADIDWYNTTPLQSFLKKTLEVVISALAFPVGWFSYVIDPPSGPSLAAVLFVPLNAYLWGHTLAAVYRRCRKQSHRSTNADP